MKAARLLCSILAVAASTASACSAARDDRSSTTAPPALASDAELDIAQVAKRSHFSFRTAETDGTLVGGHRSYVARVGRDGSLRVSPRWRPSKKERRIQLGEPSLTLATSSVEREHSLPLLAPRTSVGATGAALVDRGSVVERIVNDAGGVEQSWQVPARPQGRGDLVVRVALTTSGRVEMAGAGLRIIDDVSHHAVRYGNVAWVDARGTKTELALTWVDGQIVMRVPEEVVDRSTYPAVLDPTIAPETSVDDPLVDVPGYWWSELAAAPGKNGSFLVAWIDERVYSNDDNLFFGSMQVYGARVGADGTILDPTAFAIAPTRDFDLGQIQLAFDGNQWLAAWTQYPYNGPCTQVVATRVSETGAVLDANNIHVTCGGGSGNGTWLGWDGSAFLLVWEGASFVAANNRAFFGQYISPAGKLGKAIPFTVADPIAPTNGSDVDLACDGANQCLLVQKGAAGIHGRRIAKDGVVSADLPFTATASDTPIGVGFDGTNFVAAYQSGTTTRALRIVPSTGAVLEAGGIAVSSTLAERASSMNGQTLFMWGNGTQFAGVRMSSAGTMLDGAPLALTSGASGGFQNAVTASGNQWLIAWSDDRAGSNLDTVYVGRVSSAGAPLDGSGKIVRLAANGQRTPAAAGDANGWLVAFEDLRSRDYTTSVRLARLDANGAPLSPTSVELAAIGNSPVVAYDGTSWFVTYSDGGCPNCCGSDFGHIVTKAGVVSPPVIIGAGSGCESPGRTIFDGTSYAVVWRQNDDVALQRFSTAGAPVDAQRIIVGGSVSGFGGDVGIATNGQDYFVAWSADAPQGETAILGVRVSKASGAVLDSTPITITKGPFDIFNPKVAFDGKNYLVTWQDYRVAVYTNPDIYMARVTPAGNVLDPNGRAVAEGPAFHAWPAVIPMNDGVTALIAWSEPRRTDRFRDFGIFGTFMRIEDGTFLDPGGIPLADLAGNELFASFASRSPGNVLLLYHRDDTSAGFGAERVRGRFVSAGTLLGQACTANEQCGSRACTDGICCDSACKGTCQTCTATPGKCTPVVNAEDPDTCTADSVCDATSACKKKTGQSCVVPTDCVSGFCTDGICCESACSGSCETCSAPPGKCTLRGARETGIPRCAPYACTGTSGACPSRCESDDACPTTARCDVPTGSCVEGSYCIDSKTLGGVGPVPTACAPYTCESAACRTTCRDVHDCLYPAVCNESGSCVQPPTSALELIQSGCAMAPPSRRPSAPWSFALGLFGVLVAIRARSGTRSRGRSGGTSCR
jgi:hypothetical protein